MPVGRAGAPATPGGDAAEIARRLAATYAEAERKIAAEMARRLKAGMASPGWMQDKLDSIGDLRRWSQQLVKRLNSQIGTQVASEVERAYAAGGQAAVAELARQGQTRRGPLTPAQRASITSVERSLTGNQAIQQLTRTLAGNLQHTGLRMVRWTQDAYREAVAAGGAQDVLLGISNRRQGTQTALNELFGQGITGFTDSAGRNWNLASYVEMATRTTVAQAAVQGHLDRLTGAGIDLVMVSDSWHECPLCRPWEGKILTTGGTGGAREVQALSEVADETVTVSVAGSVSEAIAAGLLHPNCTHTISAYLPGLSTVATNTEDPAGYAATQRQRELERRIRRDSLRSAGALDDAEAAKWDARVTANKELLKAHVAANNLVRKSERERIDLGHTGRPAAPAVVAPPPAAPPVVPAAPAVPAVPTVTVSPNPAVLTGPSATNGGVSWFDRLIADTGRAAPVPVQDLELQDYVVASGSAWRIDGVSYLVEHAPGDDPLRILDQFTREHADISKLVGEDAATHQRGYAWILGRNPADAMWEQRYGIPGFSSQATAGDGSLTFWNMRGGYLGPSNLTSSMYHEFGHNVSRSVARDLSEYGHDWSDAGRLDFGAFRGAFTAGGSRTGLSTHTILLPGGTGGGTATGAGSYGVGVSIYGRSSIAEDYAESMMFYLDGVIGSGSLYPGGPVVKLYFRDLFPARAAVLDQVFPEVARRQLAAIAAR